jgi:hypothetical protein
MVGGSGSRHRSVAASLVESKDVAPPRAANVLQPVMLVRLRDALSNAERKLFLQAWHLRQLAPETVRGEAEGAR